MDEGTDEGTDGEGSEDGATREAATEGTHVPEGKPEAMVFAVEKFGGAEAAESLVLSLT